MEKRLFGRDELKSMGLLRTSAYDADGLRGPLSVQVIEQHELLDIAEHGAHVPDENRPLYDYVRSQSMGGGWYSGLESWDAATSLLRHGWPEGAARAIAVADSLSGLLPEARSIKRHRRWRDEGDELDRDRLYGGYADSCWRQTYRAPVVGQTHITIMTSWGGNGGVNQEGLFWNGATAIMLTDALESAGYGVDLLVADPTDYVGAHTLDIVRVKRAGEALNREAVAGTFCHGGLFRTAGFAAIATACQHVTGVGGQGSVPQLLPAAVRVGMIDQPNIVIDNVYSEAAAIAACRTELARFCDSSDA